MEARKMRPAPSVVALVEKLPSICSIRKVTPSIGSPVAIFFLQNFKSGLFVVHKGDLGGLAGAERTVCSV